MAPSFVHRFMRREHMLLVGVCALLLASWLPSFQSTAHASPSVRMAYLQNDIHHLALWVAMENGYFRDEGVEVEIAGVFRAGPEMMTAFGAKALDAAYVGEAPATIAVARNIAKVRVLAQANTEGTALVVSQDLTTSPKSSLTLAMPGNGSVQDLLLRKALAKLKISSERANIIVMSPPEMLTAMQAGEIDGFIAWQPYPARAMALGLGNIQAQSHDIWPGHPCCVLAASEDFLRERPNEAKALLRAHERATAFIHEHVDQALAVAVKYTGMSEDVVRQALGDVAYDAAPSVSGEEEYVGFLEGLGYIEVEDPKTFTDTFIAQDIREDESR